MSQLDAVTEEWFGEVETVSCIQTSEGLTCYIHQHRVDQPSRIECTHLNFERTVEFTANSKHLKFHLDRNLVEVVQVPDEDIRVLVAREVDND